MRESLEKEMATHSSILAWRIPWTEGPGGPQSWNHKEADTSERLLTVGGMLGCDYVLLNKQQGPCLPSSSRLNGHIEWKVFLWLSWSLPFGRFRPRVLVAHPSAGICLTFRCTLKLTKHLIVSCASVKKPGITNIPPPKKSPRRCLIFDQSHYIDVNPFKNFLIDPLFYVFHL